ncbi:MAG: HTH domain-containing protein [Chloroflexi bacterium]|nr:HTH domain-containing protein [Chloroflexota bacterium]
MPYERSRTIEERFQKALVLLKDKRLNAGQLALELDVSRPTAHRMITELKRRGHCIRSVHEDRGWAYELVEKPCAKQGTSQMK